ncbi:MAG TPA: mycothiol system anti-sigma-R factor [Actinomycetota bacterium]|nr:mycothiol system anti-sigma-R factor [Actinomycetota bacterium]
MDDGGDMECRETLRELERYVDGECLRELTIQVETHLAECTDCSDHAAFQRHLKLMVRSKCGGEQLPQGLAERIRERIRSAPP